MKNTGKLLIIFAIAIALVLGTISCGEPSSPPSNTIPWLGAVVTDLVENTWTEGDITELDGEQWFKVALTSPTTSTTFKYLHFISGTLSNVSVQVYNSNGNMTTSQSQFNGYISLSSGAPGGLMNATNEFYIKVFSSTGTGTYFIGFNNSYASMLPPDNVAQLITENNWIEATGSLWFSFIATATTQYLFHSVTTGATIMVYDSNGTVISSVNSIIPPSISPTSIFSPKASYTLTIGQEYYVRVSYGTSSFPLTTYQIGFSSSAMMFPNAVQLTEDSWTEGEISIRGGEQWFRFTGTANTQYIHFSPGTLDVLSIQVYNSSTGSTIISPTSLGYSSFWAQSSMYRSDQEYYIRVTQSSVDNHLTGTYWIGFNRSSTTPPHQLIENVWTDAEIMQYGSFRFKFTASANEQYIHISSGTLNNASVTVIDSNNSVVGSSETISSGSDISFLRTLTIGQEYYINITRSYYPDTVSTGGTCRIGFSRTIIMLPQDAVQLNLNTWTDGDIAASSGEQWFRFTANAATQFLHFSPDTLTSIDVQVYDSIGNTMAGQASMAGSSFISRSLTAGQEYYIKVSSGSSGTYRVMINNSIVTPGTSITPLNEDNWNNVNITSASREQWFSFVAAANTHYIHFTPGTLSSIGVRIYHNDGTEVSGTGNNLVVSPSGSALWLSRAVSIGQVYYIKVMPEAPYTGTYQIAFNRTYARPGVSVTQLYSDTWANGNIVISGGEQWFKFTANDTAQYIHFYPNALTGVNVQLFNSNGITDGNQMNLMGVSQFFRTLSSGLEYLIRVTPSNSVDTGTYRILFSPSTTAPPQ